MGVDLFWDPFPNPKFLKDGGWLGKRGTSATLEKHCIFILKKKKFWRFLFSLCLLVLNIYMDFEVHYKQNLKALRWGMLKLIQYTIHGNDLEVLIAKNWGMTCIYIYIYQEKKEILSELSRCDLRWSFKEIGHNRMNIRVIPRYGTQS